MPLLKPSSPPSLLHRRVARYALNGLAVAGIALGGWEAESCSAFRFGYVAGYSYEFALFLTVCLCSFGLPLLVWWRSRTIGAGLIAAGLLSCATFYGGMALLLKMDRVAWKHEPPLVSFGPEIKASLVIYYRNGTTEEQVEDFRETVLTGTAGRGYDLPVFVSTYMRLVPDQANGHWGAALDFADDAKTGQVTNYIETIKRDSRVDAVYKNIAPSAIHLPAKSDASTHSR